jgi:hypothetical protein
MPRKVLQMRFATDQKSCRRGQWAASASVLIFILAPVSLASAQQVHRFSFVPRSLKLVRASKEIAANALGGPLFIHADADIASPLSGLRALLNRVVRNAL